MMVDMSKLNALRKVTEDKSGGVLGERVKTSPDCGRRPV